MTELSDHLQSEFTVPDRDSPERDTYQIGGDREASWAFRKLAAHQAEIYRLEALARDERDRIDGWLADATSGEVHQVDFFDSLLVGYLYRLVDGNPELAKTYKVPGGKLARRKAPDRVVIAGEDAEKAENEADFVSWALDSARHDLLSIKPLVSAVKKAITPLAGCPDATDGDCGKGLCPHCGHLTFRVVGVELDEKGNVTPGQEGTHHPIITDDGEIVLGVEYLVGAENYSATAT